jgi:alkylation response protein AidB-like acyl-CoA dehydrogenase
MNFGLTEEQVILKKAARDFLEKECPRSMVRQMAIDEKGYSSQLWQKMAELGWLGLAFPTRYGGEDGNFLDLVVLSEEMGRALVPSPFFTTVVLGGLYILEAGSEEQKEEFLPGLARGDTIITLALTEPGSGYDAGSIAVEAIPHQSDYMVNGTKLFVPDAHVADYLLCVARTRKVTNPEEGITTFIMDTDTPGITCTQLSTIGRDHQCEVSFKNALATKQRILGDLDNGWKDVEKILQKATVVLCVDMNAAAQQVLDMTVNYAKERVQFGRPIGSLTAIQHHCANMTVSLEVSRSLAYEAAWKISQGLSCAREVSMAKSWVSECYTQITQLGVLIHGGLGITEEHDLPLYYRHAKASEIIMGNSDNHREKISKLILD